MKIHRYILAGLTALLMIAPCSVSAAIDPVTHREIKPVTAEAKDSGPVMIKGRMYYADSGNVTLNRCITGFCRADNLRSK